VIFAHEAIVGHYSLRAFAPITVASVVASILMRLHEFEYIALHIDAAERNLFLLDYPASAVLGLLGAGIAILFMRGMLKGGRWRTVCVFRCGRGRRWRDWWSVWWGW
jgi:CIC family chloride channel protein